MLIGGCQVISILIAASVMITYCLGCSANELCERYWGSEYALDVAASFML